MNEQEFWNELINKFGEHMKERGYSENYIRSHIHALRRILREFGDLSNVDENVIWQRYANKSKHLRKNMQQALRAFKKWLEGEY